MHDVNHDLPTRFLTGLVKTYRLLLSPWLGSSCRFFPTCSQYSLEALEEHGAAVGTYLTIRRVARCHPFCDGGLDPVPVERPRLFFMFAREESSASTLTSPHSPEKKLS